MIRTVFASRFTLLAAILPAIFLSHRGFCENDMCAAGWPLRAFLYDRAVGETTIVFGALAGNILVYYLMGALIVFVLFRLGSR